MCTKRDRESKKREKEREGCLHEIKSEDINRMNLCVNEFTFKMNGLQVAFVPHTAR